MTVEHKNINEAILGVMEEVGYVQKQSGGGLRYTYAGEAALIEAVRPSMVKHGIHMSVHRIVKVWRDQYVTKDGKAMTSTVVHGVVRFTHVSGTYEDAQAIGEGADPGDKSSGKSMTGMYKYAIRETFCIETGDDPDQFSSEAQERALKPSTTKPTSAAIATQKPLEATKSEKPSNGAVAEAEALSEGFTGNQILGSKDGQLVKELVKLTGHTTVDVCKFVGTLEKGKKYTLGQIVKQIKGEAEFQTTTSFPKGE